MSPYCTHFYDLHVPYRVEYMVFPARGTNTDLYVYGMQYYNLDIMTLTIFSKTLFENVSVCFFTVPVRYYRTEVIDGQTIKNYFLFWKKKLESSTTNLFEISGN